MQLATKTNTLTSGVTSYTYDARGNLCAVTLPTGSTITYVPDGRGRRVQKLVDDVPVQGFLYRDGLRPIAELDGDDNVVARFVYASGRNVPDYMLKGGSVYRIITDHLGSVRLVVDATSGTSSTSARRTASR